MKKSSLIIGALITVALGLVLNSTAFAQPSKPVLFSPENNENIGNKQPYLEWENAPEADNHRLVIDNDQNWTDDNIYDNDGIVGDNSCTIENQLDDNRYWWKVSAENAGGENWSENTWTFRVDTLSPTSPSLKSPDNENNTSSTSVTFTWEEPTENSLPITYSIEIATDSEFNSIENENSELTDNTYSYNFTENGKFYWHVQATDNAGNTGSWSATRWIRIDTVAPTPPGLTSPENSENINDNTPTLTWENIDPNENSTPVKYYVAVSDNSQFPHENRNSGWIENVEWTIGAALSDDNWYCHVQAKDNAGNVGDNSGWYKFQVDKHMPELVSPVEDENIDDNTPIFEWDNVAAVDNFELQIADSSDFSSLTYDNDNIVSNSHDLPTENALSDGVYYWRVRSYESGSPSLFSPDNSFRVDTVSPVKPSQTSPTNGKNTKDNTPNLDWETVSENSAPVLYRAHVSDNSQFPYDNRDSGWISDENYQLTSELLEGTWYWRVQAKDNAGNIGDNRQTSFRVDVTPPTISGITESSVDKDSATIEWNTDEPATSKVKYKENSATTWNSQTGGGNLVSSHSIDLAGLSRYDLRL